jgi:hypothetical protein
MTVLEEIIEAKAEEFNALRDVFFPPESILKLLKISDTENDYETVDVLDRDWYLKYSEYRQAFKLSIARDYFDFIEDVRIATHVAVNDEIYVIRDGDTLPPQGSNPVWTLYCERFESKAGFSSLI